MFFMFRSKETAIYFEGCDKWTFFIFTFIINVKLKYFDCFCFVVEIIIIENTGIFYYSVSRMEKLIVPTYSKS